MLIYFKPKMNKYSWVEVETVRIECQTTLGCAKFPTCARIFHSARSLVMRSKSTGIICFNDNIAAAITPRITFVLNKGKSVDHITADLRCIPSSACTHYYTGGGARVDTPLYGRVAGRRRYSIDVERFSLGGRRRRKCVRCIFIIQRCLRSALVGWLPAISQQSACTTPFAAAAAAKHLKGCMHAQSPDRKTHLPSEREQKEPRYFHQSDASAVRALPNTSVPHWPRIARTNGGCFENSTPS